MNLILAIADPADAPTLLNALIHWTSRGVEMAGVSIVVVGAIIATGYFAARVLRGGDFGQAYHTYRGHLGRAILLGLEFLVAADIIGTVTIAPTFHNLGTLAMIVLIRTFLSFSLEVEIDGRWPWQGSRSNDADEKTPL